MFTNSYVLNGVAHGPEAELLSQFNWDTGYLRPYVDDRTGKLCVTINSGREIWDERLKRYRPQKMNVTVRALQNRGINCPVWNNTTGLRRAEWIKMDEAVLEAKRHTPRAWADLMARNPVVFDGMGKLTFEYEAESDILEAVQDMDGLTNNRTDVPAFSLRSIPLPITHSGFRLSERLLATSRGRQPLDTSNGRKAATRVIEFVEKVLIGEEVGITYGTESTAGGYWTHTGTSTAYGYTNFPNRNIKTDLAIPTGANPDDTLVDVLDMIETLREDKFNGPYILYHSRDWGKFMDMDYFLSGTGMGTSTGTTMTLRDRIKLIDDIIDVRRLDFLDDTFTLVLVQMTDDVVRAINGLDLTTLEWPFSGGLGHNYKVLCIWVAQLRYDYYGNAGIVHATTA